MRKLAISFVLACLGALLSGCGKGVVPDLQTTVATTGSAVVQGVQGMVHGGQQPVSGATIQLWAVGTTGYGSAASPLISGSALTTSGVALTNATGGFNITNQYKCPSSSTLVYLTSTGGNPGLAAGTNNSALVLMAALGQCGSLSSSTFINVNEVTTVASVYALAQFINPSTGSVGGYSSTNTGLANAFATVTNLVNTSTGAALATTPNGNGVVPQAEINALADILAPCVNSSSSSSTACAALFGDLEASSGVAPSTSLLAALSIALHPGYNVPTLFSIVGGTPPFQTALTGAPNDWTVALSFASGGSGANALAIDNIGNVWVANYSSSSLSLLTPLGVPATNSPYTNSTYLDGPWSVAIDASNYAWVTNNANNTAVQFNYSVSGGLDTIARWTGPYTGLNSPKSVAVDSNNDIWITNSGNSTVTELLTEGSAGRTVYNVPNEPNGLAIDSSGDVWLSNLSNAAVTVLPSTGYAIPISLTGGGLGTSPGAVAIDGSGDGWVANLNSGVSEFSNSGTAVSPSTGYTGGGLTSAGTSGGDAIDGSGNFWAADNAANRITELSSSGTAVSPSTGYQGGSLSSPTGLAIDASGDVWVANYSPVAVNSQNQTLTEFVGVASPVVTPTYSALTVGELGTRPGSLELFAYASSNAVGTYYTNTFFAEGGSGAYTYSITSGLSALQAIGLTFSGANGTLTGTPTTAGTYPFTVQVADTTGHVASQSTTLTLYPTVCSHDGSGNAVLNGNYAFLMTGFDPSGHVYDEIGDFKANGSGTISNGNGDVNSGGFASVGEQNYTFSGTYSVGSTDERGIMTVSNTNTTGTGLPASANYCFAADTIVSGVAQSGRIIEADGSGFVLTGSFAIQNTSSFNNASLTGGYAYGIQGVYQAQVSGSPVTSRVATAGEITLNGSGGLTGGQFDSATYQPSIATTAYSAANVYTTSGSSYSVGANGRGTLTLVQGGVTYTYVIYVTGTGGQFFLLTSGNWTAGSLQAGKAIQQTTSSFTTANVKAIGIYHSNGTSNPTSSQILDNMRVGQFTLDGAGNFSYVQDQSNGGSVSTPVNNYGSGTYTVTSSGYLTLNYTSGTPVYFYLYAPGGGFGLNTTTAVQAFTMVPQTVPSGGFTSINLGGYALGTVFPLAYSANDGIPNTIAGTATFSSGGTFTFVSDQAAAPGTPGNFATDESQSGMDVLDPVYGPTAGRFTVQVGLGVEAVGYIISPYQAFILSQQSNQNPELIEADHQ